MQVNVSYILEVFEMNDKNLSKNYVREHTFETYSPETTDMIDVHMGPPGKDLYTGILHIYKEENESNRSSDTLAIINIHASLPVKSIISFLYPFWQKIKTFTVVKTKNANRYTTIVEFKYEEDARLCLHTTDGMAIDGENSEPLTLVYVQSFVISKTDDVVPPEASIELPSCPICLEKLDETISGIMTVQCSHCFHQDCIYKWKDSNCPVCRLDLSPLDTGDQKCRECGATESLWMCLICGNVGCDRYSNKHSVKHFELTNHAFSKQVGGSRVWDYVSDCYVYRIIVSDNDRKIIQWERLPKADDKLFDNEDFVETKISCMENEYIGVIALQLESQKELYESRINSLTKGYHEKVDQLRNESETTTKDYEHKIDALTQVIQKLKEKNNDLNKKYKEEKLITMQINKNEQTYKQLYEQEQEQFSLKEKSYISKINDLSEQLDDMYSHFCMQNQLKEAADQAGDSFENASIQTKQNNPRKNLFKKRRR